MELSREQRGLLVRLILLVFGGVLALRFFFLQVVSYGTYYRISEENRLRLVPIPAPRGILYDRSGRVIVDNRTTYTVSVIPSEVKDIDRLAQTLAPLLGLDREAFWARFKRGPAKPNEPVRVKRDVDFRTIAVLEEQNEDFPGVLYQVEQTRNYPPDTLGSHFSGYIGEASETELTKNPQLWRGTTIGKQGLERIYDDLLRGGDGAIFLEVTAQGKVLGQLADRPPEPARPGSDLFLTIDLDIQAVAESALAGSCCGAAVALDPRTGEVLAFVSKPGFDANAFVTGLSLDQWQKVSGDSTHPMLNRTIQGLYPPGSTVKLLTAGAALESHLITPAKRFNACQGALWFGNRLFRCWKPEGHGSLDLYQAIVQSCDVYFYQLGLALGLERWGEYAAKCGFGQKTGIDLTDEWAGVLPTAAYYARRFGQNQWPKGVMLNLSIGQGEFLVTPLQLATFFGALGNDGAVFRPHLLKRYVDPDGLEREIEPVCVRQLPFSPGTLRFLKTALVGVVNDPHGTATVAQLPGISVAGKTGTAQNPHGLEHAWFACFAPAEKPEIAVAVLVENAGHGGTVAAPIAREMLRAYFTKTHPLLQPEVAASAGVSDRSRRPATPGGD